MALVWRLHHKTIEIINNCEIIIQYMELETKEQQHYIVWHDIRYRVDECLCWAVSVCVCVLVCSLLDAIMPILCWTINKMKVIIIIGIIYLIVCEPRPRWTNISSTVSGHLRMRMSVANGCSLLWLIQVSRTHSPDVLFIPTRYDFGKFFDKPVLLCFSLIIFFFLHFSR